MNKETLEFPISLYGNFEKVNDVLTKSRCRIFYKGGNRNGTYITDEFANELISTLHYVPVKGIYQGNDYTDHGYNSGQGKIYGIVPEQNNFAWETHLDEDGIERTYACTDVYLFTALYPEAERITGKGHSMELFEPSLKYHKEVIQGLSWIVFEHGSFLGLQVLGDNVEPCFEGASFYTLQSSIEETINKIKEYTLGGKQEMKINFKLSDDAKFEAIWTLLNDEYNEEHGWIVSYSVVAVYDEYALARNYGTGDYERVYYTKDDENDSVALGERVKVYIVDVTEKEKETLDTLHRLNGSSYELVSENLTNADANAENCANFASKIDELNTTISTLNTEIESVRNELSTSQASVEELESKYSKLSEDYDTLVNYKKSIEDAEKESVILQYSKKLNDEILDSYRGKLDEFTAEELDMHLAYELKKANPTALSFEEKDGVVPKDVPEETGVERILARYKK